MKVVAISDTHEQHKQLTIPECDLLIHAGDITWAGSMLAYMDFMNWFGKQPAKHKVFIAGNHDFHLYEPTVPIMAENDITYLQDNGTTIEGVNIYGSPWTPTFGRWAFMQERGDAIAEYWSVIPEGLDILVTHGPPMGILDKTDGGVRAGCKDLALRLKKVKPKVHIFGHIHEAHGRVSQDDTIYLNVSSYLTMEPIVFEI